MGRSALVARCEGGDKLDFGCWFATLAPSRPCPRSACNFSKARPPRVHSEDSRVSLHRWQKAEGTSKVSLHQGSLLMTDRFPSVVRLSVVAAHATEHARLSVIGGLTLM